MSKDGKRPARAASQAAMEDQKNESNQTSSGSELSAPPDLYTYFGDITYAGYCMLCDEIANAPCGDSAVLYLATNGGDPDAAFRIARALQHSYANGFSILIPAKCKSAGTLVAVGATHLIMADSSELGPLDIQVNKPDEVLELTSGLNIFHAQEYLTTQAFDLFVRSLLEIKFNAGLGTQASGRMAAKLTAGCFGPIFSQLDPNRLGEMHRLTAIAEQYAKRLDEKSSNLQPGALSKLLTAYPSHSFVIDRKEARTLFHRVEAPTPTLEAKIRQDHGSTLLLLKGKIPSVQRHALSDSDDEQGDSPTQTGEAYNDHADDQPAGTDNTVGTRSSPTGSDPGPQPRQGT